MKYKTFLLSSFLFWLLIPVVVLAGGNKDDSLCDKDYTQNGPYCEKLTGATRQVGSNKYFCPAPGGYHDYETVQLVNNNQCLYTYAINPYGDQTQYGEYDESKSPSKQESSTVKPNSTIDPKLDYSSICANEGPRHAVRIIGYIVQIAKWVTPFIIIVLGMLDFGKAVVSSDEKAINKAASSLIKRIVAGLIVFFIPTIVIGILNAIKITNGIQDEKDSNFGACTVCLFDPGNCN